MVKMKHADNAVSSVVGVMLMVVVVVIIAGVVSVFASGLVTDTSAAPTAQIKYVGVMDGVVGGVSEIGLVFENAGGDPIYLEDLILNLKNEATGKETSISYTDNPSSLYRNVMLAGETRLSSAFTYRFKKIGIDDTAEVANKPVNLRVSAGERFVVHADRYIADANSQGSVYYVAERGSSIYSDGTFKVSSRTSYTLVDKNTGSIIASGTLVGEIL
jgi:FlaG/FlaF family flagellin (archaellin)